MKNTPSPAVSISVNVDLSPGGEPVGGHIETRFGRGLRLDIDTPGSIIITSLVNVSPQSVAEGFGHCRTEIRHHLSAENLCTDYKFKRSTARIEEV